MICKSHTMSLVDEVIVRCCVCDSVRTSWKLELEWCLLDFSNIRSYFEGATPKRCGWEWRMCNYNSPERLTLIASPPHCVIFLSTVYQLEQPQHLWLDQ